MEIPSQNRTPREVFESHIDLRVRGNTEEDIQKNYAEDVVVVSNWGTFRGHEGVRKSAQILSEHLPNPSFEFDIAVVEANVGYLVWSAESSSGDSVKNGVDSLIIQSGKITAHTIYYKIS